MEDFQKDAYPTYVKISCKSSWNTHLIKSLKPILDIFNLLYSYVIVEGLCGAWKVKNNPSKTYIRNIVKLREKSIGTIETRQKGHGK
jgi:hypothetical protein